MSVWRFLDYCTPERKNQIAPWHKKQPAAVKNEFAATLYFLSRFDDWSGLKKYFKPLTGKPYKGLYEIRFKVIGIEYRPVGCFGLPNTKVFVLLAGCYKKNSHYTPRDALNTAAKRKSELEENIIENIRRCHERPTDPVAKTFAL